LLKLPNCCNFIVLLFDMAAHSSPQPRTCRGQLFKQRDSQICRRLFGRYGFQRRIVVLTDGRLHWFKETKPLGHPKLWEVCLEGSIDFTLTTCEVIPRVDNGVQFSLRPLKGEIWSVDDKWNPRRGTDEEFVFDTTASRQDVGLWLAAFKQHMSFGWSLSDEAVGSALDPIVGLPRMTVKTIHAEDDAASANCPICFCGFTEGQQVSTTSCGHIFHQDCIQSWLQKSSSCPMCRTWLPSKTDNRLERPEGNRNARTLFASYR